MALAFVCKTHMIRVECEKTRGLPLSLLLTSQNLCYSKSEEMPAYDSACYFTISNSVMCLSLSNSSLHSNAQLEKLAADLSRHSISDQQLSNLNASLIKELLWDSWALSLWRYQRYVSGDRVSNPDC